jgi:glycolate oxidase FAD binding subunit
MIADPAALSARFETLLGSGRVTVTNLSRWAIEGVAPRVVVRPGDAEQIGAVLRLCGEKGAAVVPWGGGTAMEVGNPPRAADVVLLTDRLSRVVDHDHSNLTITVQAGITLGDLDRGLAEHRQFLPLEPPRAELATAGGAVAENLSGPRRMLYGGARDLVIGMRVVQAHGALIKMGGKTVKNVAGYDMAKLFVGSLGTLGVITEVTFKVYPLPETSRTVAVWGAEASALMALAGKVLASPLLPAAVTMVNRAAAAAVGRDAPGLLVRAQGVEAAVDRHERDIKEWAAASGLATPLGAAAPSGLEVEMVAGDAEAALWRAIRDAGWNGQRAAVRLDVPSGEVSAVLELLPAVVPTSAGVMAHLATGTIWIAAEAAALTPSMLTALRDLAAGRSGNLLIARARRSLKAEGDVWHPLPRALEVMRALKQSFDPQNILNPGRFVAGL